MGIGKASAVSVTLTLVFLFCFLVIGPLVEQSVLETYSRKLLKGRWALKT